MTLPAKSVPESVAHLDMGIIEAALIRNDASIRNAARDLNVPSADLRKLMLLDQRLADASTEAVELQLDECEANLREGLRSDDPKRRDAISMFFLRNVHRAAKRGYAVAASAASLEVSLGEREPRNIVISWLGERETETIERDGQTFEVPRYGDGRSDGYLEGELVTPRTLIEHGVDHCVDHCVDHQVEPTIVEPAEPAAMVGLDCICPVATSGEQRLVGLLGWGDSRSPSAAAGIAGRRHRLRMPIALGSMSFAGWRGRAADHLYRLRCAVVNSRRGQNHRP